ncbi:MAG TPA: ABC transporter substrate-binding protein [Thermoanaerobaculia bacterium]|nr:ABC transporter substrate-binding protein [Thermoanaerobaculia bacterium]
MKRLCAALLLCVLACRRAEPPVAARPAATPRPAPIAAPVLGYIDENGMGTPVDSPVLRRRLIGDPATLNAVMQSGVPEQQVLQYVSRNLIDFDARMRLVPGLAERYDVSADGRTFTFELRREAVWEDGSPVTAADAVFTLNKIVDRDTPAPVIKPLFLGLETAEATGEKTFRIRFRKADANQAMAFVLPLLPEKRFAKRRFLRAPDNRAPFSNGPYRFVSWKPQESIELVRNEKYWGPRPHFERIVFKILPDNTTAWRALVEGGLDETWIDQALKEKSGADPAFAACCRVVEYYDLDYNFIALNNRSPLFSDARVRRALTMLLDRSAIVRSLYRGSARIISGPWAPDSPAYDAAVAPLPYDPAAAGKLLDEAGWRDTNGNGTRDRAGREFVFDLLVSSGSLIGEQIDEVLAAAAMKAGIEVRVRPLEWSAYVNRLDHGEFEAASGAWSASGDPNPDLFGLWHSSQFPPQGANSSFFQNAEADRLIEEARAEIDEKRRLAIYRRLHVLFRDEAPAIWVVNASKKYALRKGVRGLTTSQLGLFGTWPGPVGWWAEPGP